MDRPLRQGCDDHLSEQQNAVPIGIDLFFQ
jgi:hypothetical protein